MDYADLIHHPLTVVHVTESPAPPAVGGYPAIYRYPRAEVHRAVRIWMREMVEKVEADRGRKFGREVSLKVVEGNPARLMVDRSHEAAMTVVGRRGSGGFKRLLIGSVATALAHHAQSSVVVVPSK
jgi:nucleotide-binding universal stress UspA family protein